MRQLAVISKLTGVSTNVETAEVTLNTPSIVKLAVSRDEISQMARVNQDLVITLHSGETVTIKNFYVTNDQGASQLVLQDNNGALWWVQDTDGAFHYQQIDDLTPLMATESSHEGGAIWPWVLAGVVGAGGIAAIAASGGGGGGHHNDDNGSGNGNGNGSNPGNGNGDGDGNGNGDGDGDGDGNGNTPNPPTTTPTIPSVPTITSVTDNVDPVTGAVGQQQSTNDNTPTLQGTGQANTLLHIYDNGKEIGQVTVDASGKWSFTPSSPLTDGRHQFTVNASNSAGSSDNSASWTIIVDTVAPNAPVVSQETDNVGTIVGTIGSNGITDDATPTLSGTGSAGNIISVYDNNGVLLGTTQVDSSGQWSFTPGSPLSEGTHNLTVTQTDAAGNVSSATAVPPFTVDTTPPPAAIISGVNTEGTVVSGSAEPGSTVTIVDGNNQVLGSTKVDRSGNFTINITPAQTHGESLTAQISDAAGNAGQNTPFTGSNTGYPPVPVVLSVTDDAAPSTGPLSNNQATNDSTPTLNGTAEANSTVNIIDNGVKIDSVTADASGNWTWTPSTALSDGPHALTVSATNAAGTGGASTAFTVNIDTTPPAQPTDLEVSADGGSVTGTTEPGNTVTITDANGVPIGTATAGTDGKFTVTISPPQTNGETLTAISTDPAGNASAPENVIAKDTTAPGAPDNLLINQAGNEVSGVAEPNSTVNILDAQGNIIGTTTASNTGEFTVTLDTPLNATATDAAGNTSPKSPVTAPDTTAPDAPTGVIVAGDGSSVSGSAEAGSTITVKDSNGNTIGQGQTDSGGNFTVPLSPAQTNGETVNVNATDSKENVSPDTSAVAPDITAPDQPVITAITDDVPIYEGAIGNGNVTNDSQPKLEGTAEANSQVKIYDNGLLLTTLTADAGGNWSYTPTTALGQGVHIFTVTATDAANNTSSEASWEIIVDSLAPTAPAITLVADNVGTITGDVANNGGVTNDPTPTISGTGEPGTLVTLYDNGETLGTALVDSSGTWSYTVPDATPLSDDTHNFTVSASDAAGNVTTSPTVVTVTVDTLAPDAPTITAATDDVGSVQADLTTNQRTDDTLPLLKGTGTVGSTVTLYDGATPIGSVVVPAGGNWSIQLTQPLSEGTHNLTAVATDAAGNASSPGSFTLTIDTTPPAAPVILAGEGLVGNATVTLANGGSTKSNQPVLSGSGEPGATITIADNGTPLGTAVVQPDGTWTFTPETTLTEGSHKFTATATDVAGNTGIPSASFTLTVDNTPPVQPGIPTITDNVDPVTGVVINGNTNDTTPTFSGTGTAGDVISVFLNGSTTPLGTAVVGADGKWSLTPTDPINPDSYQITVTATDPAGNVSTPSAPTTLNIDITPPTDPTITAANDNVGALQGDISANGTTDDSTPTIRGTGEEGSTITLYNGTTVIGTTTVAGGVWSITPGTPLPDGSYTLTAVATDAAGNPSGSSNSISFTVSTAQLTAPQVTDIIDDSGVITGTLNSGSDTDDLTPTISGTGTPGSTILIYDNGGTTPLITTTVGPDGTWRIDVPLTANTEHTLTFGAQDAAGNVIPAGNPIVLTTDTLPPGAPTVDTIDPNGTLVSGTAEPGSTVIISSGTTILGQAVADTNGDYTVTLSPAQTAGEALNAIAQDPAGNQSGQTPFNAATSGIPHPPTLEIVDDVAPGLGVIGNGKTTNDTQPTLQGVATAGADVHIYQNGILLITVTADVTTGEWSYPLPTALAEGTTWNYTVSQTVEGVDSGLSPVYAITIDTTAPLAPTIVAITDDVAPVTGNVGNGQSTNDARPTLSGTGEAGATITLYDGGLPIGTTTVNSSGNWTLTPQNALDQGEHTFTVRATDAAGNEGSPSAGYVITVDTVPPGAPVLVSVTDNVGVTTTLISGQATNDNTPTLAGTTEANAVVTVRDNGTVIGTATADATGNWTFTPSPALGEGSHALTATVTDAAGNVSPATPPFTLLVDTQAPSAPIIVSVIDDQPGNTLLTNGQLTNDAQPTLNGTAEANATVTILNNGTALGTATADGSGNWTFTPGSALEQGENVFTVTATDAAGNTSGASSSFTVQVDSLAPAAPVILNVQDNTTPTTGPITNGQTSNETRPALSGTGEVGATITVLSDGQPIGTTLVGAGGTWSFTPATALGNGAHTLTVTATDNAGNTSLPSGGFTYTVDTQAPSTPAITVVADDFGTLQGNLTSGQSTDDARPALSGTAEANARVNIYDNGALIGTVTADAGGAWSFTPATALGNGSHALTVTATDAAGNVSAPSTAFNLIVDTTAPVAPSIIQALDDVLPGTGTLLNGAFTNDTRPELSGTAEANARVAIYDNGNLLFTVTAAADGSWSYLPDALATGPHVFTAIATDAAGNVSPASASFTLTVDTSAPGVPVLTTVVDDVAGGVFNGALTNGQVTNDARPTLNGTAEAGSTVSVYDGATLLGTATVQSNNTWSFTPSAPLGNGSHTLTITATDAAGNISSATAGFTVVVDTTAPTTPSIGSIVDDVGPILGTIGNNQPTNDARPTLNGTTEANATVTIYDNGTLVTSVTADASGNWSFTPTGALSQGNHSFTITTTDVAGNTSGMSPAAAIVVDTIAPVAPTGLAVTANGTTLTGVAEANSTVTITSGTGTVLGTATANASGNFTFTLNPPQVSGQTIQVTAQDAAGNIGTAASVLAPIIGVPAAPLILSVLDDVGPVLGSVAAGNSTNDTRPTLSGTAQANATVSVFNNGVLMGTTTADGSGSWSFTPGGALSEGNHAFTASAANVNGSGALSTSFNVIVDTTPPSAPTLLISADGSTVSGIAEAGSTVTITLPGGTTATAVANSSGVYSVTLSVRQIEGQLLSATATDQAGNVSSPTSVTAPILPLLAEDNVTNLALETSATVSNEHYSDYGFLLVNALGTVANVLGTDTATVNFSVDPGGSGSVTIDAAATGVVLSLLSSMEIVIQRYDTSLNAWVTVVDTSNPQFADLLTLGASGVTLNYDGLTGGDYRVVSYNTSLLATGSYTSLDVSVVKTSAGTITGGGTESGNVITDIDPTNGQDNAPSGTLVTSITDANGNVLNVPAGGLDVLGKYGTLHINQNGSYTYTLTNTSASVYGAQKVSPIR